MVLLAVALALQSSVLTATLADGARIRLTRSTVVILDSDSLDFALGAAVVGNDVFVSGLYTPVMRFDGRTGRFLGEIARRGSGPGEVRSVPYLHAVGDSLFAYDQELRRASLFGPDRYRFVRQTIVRARQPTSVAPLAGAIVVATVAGPAQAVGFGIHVHAWDGALLRSYGATRRLRPGRPSGIGRVIAPGPGGSVWSVTQLGPTVLERFSGTGDRTLAIVYAASAEPDSLPGGPRVARLAVQPLDSATVLVLTTVPDRDWRRGTLAVPPDEIHGKSGIAIGSRPRLWDSEIDAIDVGSGRIVGRLRVDEWVSHLLPGGMIVAHRESPTGEPVIAVERLQLSPPLRSEDTRARARRNAVGGRTPGNLRTARQQPR